MEIKIQEDSLRELGVRGDCVVGGRG